MSSSPRYGCTIRGHCEPSSTGIYTSREECEADCQGAESADLIYLILSYDWETAATALPSDQQEIIKRTFDLRVSTAEAERIIRLLTTGEISLLLQTSPTFEDYLLEQLTPLQMMLLEATQLIRPGAVIVNWVLVENTLRSSLQQHLMKLRPEFLVDRRAIYYMGFSIRDAIGRHNGNLVGSSEAMRDLITGYLPALVMELAPERWTDFYPE